MSESAVPTEPTTLANLQAAYEGESNAAAKYKVYAEKADADGYHGAAALFRAAAHAELIHASNHAAVIREKCATPEAVIALPPIGATLDNLKDAVAGETHEFMEMYPAFMAEARGAKEKGAMRSFAFAKAAEQSHAKLYQSAVDNLDDWKAPRAFYVCRVCGETVESLDFEKCPVCNEPLEAFDKVE